jgi:ABC-type taurine transport system substrate-binding protein
MERRAHPLAPCPTGIGASRLIMQPKRELTARKYKEIRGKTLAFPFISFSESGLFNGLQRIQIKKSAAG